MLALRIFLPEVGFNLSTRESSQCEPFDPLGVTMMSAGSSHPARRLRHWTTTPPWSSSRLRTAAAPPRWPPPSAGPAYDRCGRILTGRL